MIHSACASRLGVYMEIMSQVWTSVCGLRNFSYIEIICMYVQIEAML